MTETFSHVEPVLEILADVVPAEWQHRHRIAAHSSYSAGGGRSCFRSHGRTEIHTMIPVERLIDQRHGVAAASAENNGTDWHALAFFDVRIQCGVVPHRGGEPAVWMRSFFLRGRRPIVSAPINRVGGG